MAYKAQKQHAPVDESVQMPAAIRAAAERSAALHKTAYQTEPPATPQDKNGENGQTQKAEPEVKTPAAEANPEPKTPAPAGDENWEHRYLAMKGRNDKNEKMLSEQGGELNQLRAEVNRLSQLVNQPRQERTNENSFKKITAEEREAFGDDFIDVAKRAAAEVFMPEIEQLKQQVVQLGGTVENVARTTHDNQTMTMNQFLDKELPNWREINRSQRFLAWVGLRDPYSNGIRIDMMRAAHAEGNAQRVLAFFRGFLSDEATTGPTPEPTTPLVTPQGNDKVSLESLAAPGRAKASASSTPANDPDEKEIITRAQVQEFYRLKNSNYYRGRDDEAKALEERIFAAQRDGRIR